MEWLPECYELHMKSIIGSGERVEGRMAGGGGRMREEEE